MTEHRFHHVGVLVEGFDEIQRVLGGCLGLGIAAPEPEPELGIEILWVTVGGVGLEFIRPLDADSRAAAALSAGKGGVHHVALAVDDLEDSLSELREAGVALLDETPRRGAHGSRIAFIDPAGAGGTLVELVEPGGWDAGAPK
jgi:methylmalonyl-CoA/ethylmalonyl-CoA epimerase